MYIMKFICENEQKYSFHENLNGGNFSMIFELQKYAQNGNKVNLLFPLSTKLQHAQQVNIPVIIEKSDLNTFPPTIIVVALHKNYIVYRSSDKDDLDSYTSTNRQLDR